ncbi:DUF551 domain-containing protein [Pseudomonas citronellolis]|uniref:DUF551 domain-containing protein n=1 Tax=Pseudomonas citronellolis TaxID=53408 RepID=UPI00248DE1E7|nr:DUF551 domain-containing protein [Pseudomonas citronellolis]
MTAEIADLRAAQARPSVDLEHIGSLISVFRNATRADAENGGREYFEKASNAERELREAVERTVGALRAEAQRQKQITELGFWAETATDKECKELRAQLNAAQAGQVSKWISISDRLPPNGVLVLIAQKGLKLSAGGVSIGAYHTHYSSGEPHEIPFWKNALFGDTGCGPSHWRPLPRVRWTTAAPQPGGR